MTSAPEDPMAVDGPVEPVLLPPRGLVAFVLVAMLLTAVAGVLLPGSPGATTKPSLLLSIWIPDEVELGTILHRRQALLNATSAGRSERQQAEQVMLDGLRTIMATEARLGVQGAIADANARRARGELEERVRDHVLAHGNDALKAMALRYAGDVRLALERALVALTQSGGSLTSASDDPTARERLAHLERVAPGSTRAFAGVGVERFMNGERLGPAAGLVVEAVAEQRVLGLGQRLPHPRPELDSDLRRLLERFRVEAHAGLDLKRRLVLLEQLVARDPTYPERYVTAVLLARAGRYRAAVGAFQAAALAGQLPRLARANARWSRQQHKRASSAVAP